MMPVVGLMTSPQNRTNSARQLLLVSNNSTVHEASKLYKRQSMVFFPLYFQDLRRVSVLLTRPSTQQQSLEGMSAFLMFNLKALNSAKLTSSLMYLVAHVPEGFPSPCNLRSVNLSTRCKLPSTNLKDDKWFHTVIVASEEGRLRVNSVQYYTCTYLCFIPLCLCLLTISPHFLT